MKRTIVVNLFGSPGAGKSTGAAYIFSRLKMMGVDAELITEFPKDMVWEHNEKAVDNQVYVLGQQYFRQYRCDGEVDVIITDSPILLSILYNKNEKIAKPFNELTLATFNLGNNINYFVNRAKEYNPNGRLHTEKQANEIAGKNKDLLENYGIEYTEIEGTITGYEEVVYDVMDKVRNNND